MFTVDSQIVKSYVLLVKTGSRTMEQVPDYENLREVVASVLSAAS